MIGEYTSLESQPFPDEIKQIVEVLGKLLLEEESFANLSVADLRAAGVLSPDMSLAEYLYQELKLDRSFVSEALAQLEQTLPPPIDMDAIYQAEDNLQVDRGLEEQVRKEQLQGSLNTMQVVAERANLRDFGGQIWDSAQVYSEAEDSSVDPQEVEQDLEVWERAVSNVPTTWRTKDKRRLFALRVPRRMPSEPTTNLTGLIGPPGLDSFVVVSDPDKNSRLSSFLYSHPELLSFYVLRQIIAIQQAAIGEIKKIFSQVALSKYESLEHEVEATNQAIKYHFFHLLEKLPPGTAIQLVKVVRDHYDTAAHQQEKSPKLDRSGSESSAFPFTIVTNSKGEVSFMFKYAHPTWEKIGDERVQTYQMVTDKVDARFNLGTLQIEYRYVNQGTLTEWQSYDNPLSGPLYYVMGLLDGMEAVTVEQKLEYGKTIDQETRQIIDDVTRTTTISSFVAKLRELGVGGYPNTEYLVSPKIPLAVDEVPDPAGFNPKNN